MWAAEGQLGSRKCIHVGIGIPYWIQSKQSSIHLCVYLETYSEGGGESGGRLREQAAARLCLFLKSVQFLAPAPAQLLPSSLLSVYGLKACDLKALAARANQAQVPAARV